MAIYKDVETLELVTYQGESEDFDKGIKFILEKLDALPVADVAEVVRCKDCADRYTKYCKAKHERADMDYCSHGKRKENNK